MQHLSLVTVLECTADGDQHLPSSLADSICCRFIWLAAYLCQDARCRCTI